MVFDDNPKSLYYIKSPKYRMDLNRIINCSCPTDGQRLFLVCFLNQQLKWDELRIVEFIDYYNRWIDNNKHGHGRYDRGITTRQVNMILEKIKDGKLGAKIQTSYSSTSRIETQREKTQNGNFFGKIETQIETNSTNLCLNVSKLEQDKIEEEVDRIEVTQVITKVHNGTRWFKIAEKIGKHGRFFSLDSGRMVKVSMEDGSEQLGFGEADKYFSLPNQAETLTAIISGLQTLLPKEEKTTKK